MRKDKYNALHAGLLAVLLGLIIMLPSMVRFNGIFVIRGDYVNQTLTRLVTAKTMLFGDAAPLWNWKNFLGTAYTGAYSILFSFNAICMLFPAKLMPYAAMLALCLRWFVIGVSSYAFLRRFVSKHESALIGSMLYCFSGFAFVSLEFVAFYNTMAVFPLLLLAVEKRFTDENYKFVLIPVALVNLLASSYLFIGSSIALLFYALARFFTAEEWKNRRKFRYIALCVAEYMIGVLICGFTVFNFIDSMLSTSRATTSLSVNNFTKSSFTSMLVPKFFFDELAGVFLPAASNRVTTFYSYTTWYSMQAYLPVFGFAFCFASLFKNKLRDSLNIVLIVMLIYSVIPLLNYSASFYTNRYTRWWYALTLIMTAITVRAYDGFDDELYTKPMRSGVFLQWAAVVILPLLYVAVYFIRGRGISAAEWLIAVFFKHDYEYGFAEDIFRIFSVSAAVLFTAALTLLVFVKKIRKYTLPILCALIAVYGMGFVALNNSDAPVFDKLLNNKADNAADVVTLADSVDKYYLEDKTVNTEPYSYRIDHTSEIINYSAVVNTPSICFFESTIDSDAIRFASFAGMGTKGGVSYKPKGGDNALRTLLSVKYFYDLFPDKETQAIPDGFVYSHKDKNVDVYENENFLPFGFAYDSYITESELSEIEDANASTMLHTLVITEEDIDKVSGYLVHCDSVSPDLEADVAARRRCVSSDFKGDSSGFTAEFSCQKDEVVFFSVPYDEGWAAEIDGKACPFFRANLGFMAVIVPAGEHTVTFRFHNGTIVPGLLCSACGVICAAAYVGVCSALKNKKNKTINK